MSEFQPARPRYTLPFAGTDYELLGTLEVVEAIEATFKEGIIQITARVMDMSLTDISKLVGVLCNLPAREVARTILDDLGVHSAAYTATQMHLYAFLRVTLEPPELREAMAKDMGELIGKFSQASRGESTKSSA